MKIFDPIYKMVMNWARHPAAEKYLAAVSFAESSFFPIPVDVMLAPMALADRSKAWRYAFIATVMSVLGALAGYFFGAVLFDSFGQQVIDGFGWQHKFDYVKEGFNRWGVLIVLIASFTPFPYKIVTISAGIVSLPLLPFILLSIVGRGGRFFLVSGLIYFFGDSIESVLDKWVERIGWGTLILTVLGVLAYYFLG